MIENEEQVKDDGAAAAEATTAGASSLQGNAYIAAAAVVIYTTRALWLRLRRMMSARSKANGDHDTENSFDALEDQRQQELDLCAS